MRDVTEETHVSRHLPASSWTVRSIVRPVVPPTHVVVPAALPSAARVDLGLRASRSARVECGIRPAVIL